MNRLTNAYRILTVAWLGVCCCGGAMAAGSAVPGLERSLTVPPPAGVEARRIAFTARNSPENLDRLGREFFALIDFSAHGPAALRTERNAFVALAQQRKYPEALKAFKVYFLKRLALDPVWNEMGQGPTLPDAERDRLVTERLMRNIVARSHGADTMLMDIGEPGGVNWGFQLPKIPDEWDWSDGRDGQFYSAAFLQPLWRQFRVTRERALLAKWSAFADDWAMHQSDGWEHYGPYDLPAGGANVSYHLIDFLDQLRGFSLCLAPQADELSEATLARLLIRYTREFPIYSIVFMRDNAQNWSIGQCGSLVQLGTLMGDFKDAALWAREGRRRLENYDTVINLRDGTEIQPDPWYLWAWVEWTAPVYQTLRRELQDSITGRAFTDWFTPDWQLVFRAGVRQRARFLAHSVGPNGEDPVGLSTDKRDRGSSMYVRAQRFVPELFAEPDTRLRLEIAARHAVDRFPAYTSEWYPYGGYDYLRTGWGPQDPYAVFFNLPGRGSNGFRSQANNNSVYLSAWGMDFLWTGAVAAYNYCKSPVRVDGRDQHKYAGRPQSNHRAFGTAWYDPAPWRWHSSSRFDFCEGVYNGPYANFAGHHPRNYSVEAIVEANRTAVHGVTHHRLFHVLKDQGLWIVTDRMISDREHEYRQDWRLPSPLTDERAKYPTYDSKEIVLDAKDRVIHTEAAAIPNISFFHFGQDALRYDTEIENAANSPDQPKKRLVNFQRIGAAWKGRGASQLVTILYPRKDANAEVLAPRPLKLDNGSVGGFTLTRRDGTTVSYLSAPASTESMTVGGLKVNGEALLVVAGGTNSAASLRGVALGCKSMTLAGSAVAVPQPDFEFVLTSKPGTRNPELSFVPIYRPIMPVDILPARDVFLERETISLACRTPGVEIRYTLDGSDPTPAAPVYTGPFEIKHTTWIKARAFRPGVKTTPPTMEGTLATVVSSALLTRQDPVEPAKVAPRGLKPGLDYQYFEDNWKFLYLSTEHQQPVKSGTVASVLDVSPKNAQQSKAYAFEYSGYLDVPADGVYTFHAPYELTHGDIWPGYDLQLWVGERTVNGRSAGLNQWYPGTRIHALGNWSIALRKGLHRFRMHFADIRPGQKISILHYTDYTVLNPAGMDRYVWDGVVPDLRVSGPGLDRQPIPAAWLRH